MQHALAQSAPAAASRTAAQLDRFVPYVLSLLRIMAGLMFLEHGLSKLIGFPPHGPIHHFPEMEFFAALVEVAGGTLVALGLFTRQAAFIMSGEMAIGYFLVHAPRSFFPLINGGDGAVLYCFIFFYLFFAGPGPLSLDALRRGRG